MTTLREAAQQALAEPERDWEDLYHKEKARADMWRDKYESMAGPDERVYPQQEQEPVAWLDEENGAPTQRKPLAEWQINDLMADIDPEDVCSWSFRQGVYAAEKHHGVKQ